MKVQDSPMPGLDDPAENVSSPAIREQASKPFARHFASVPCMGTVVACLQGLDQRE
jgi:hypothetical protein